MLLDGFRVLRPLPRWVGKKLDVFEEDRRND